MTYPYHTPSFLSYHSTIDTTPTTPSFPSFPWELFTPCYTYGSSSPSLYPNHGYSPHTLNPTPYSSPHYSYYYNNYHQFQPTKTSSPIYHQYQNHSRNRRDFEKYLQVSHPSFKKKKQKQPKQNPYIISDSFSSSTTFLNTRSITPFSTSRKFSSISVEIDDNPFKPWEIPVLVKDASSLQNFSANNANVKGKLPDCFDEVFPFPTLLHLASNKLEGVLPKSFSGLKVESLWWNDQKNEGNGKPVEVKSESNVKWALGKAGEDRVHVVVSEEQGWLFVGIYDGFNGPDAPEFLMDNMYRAIHNELQGLFWEVEEAVESHNHVEEKNKPEGENSSVGLVQRTETAPVAGTERKRRRLWEFLAEDSEDGLALSGSDRFAFSVDDAFSVSNNTNAGSASSRRWLLLSKLNNGLSSKQKEDNGRKLPWSLGNEEEKEVKAEVENKPSASDTGNGGGRRRKLGPIDQDLVLNAMSRALQVTELAYLDMTDKLLDINPELALMGSCLFVALMRDKDVYVMNVGDSRAMVAHYEPKEFQDTSNVETASKGEDVGVGSSTESIVEESLALDGTQTEGAIKLGNQGPAQEMRLAALQLSTDHNTNIEEEIIRIKNEHPDDPHCIVNDRVKVCLKVTRAFGAGSLKLPKLNAAVLEMFCNDYNGTAPYISCIPSLRHHRLCPRDQFLILLSDGLYQYLNNDEVVSQVESFMEKFPEGDPAQHLIEELLLRAAKKVETEELKERRTFQSGIALHEKIDFSNSKVCVANNHSDSLLFKPWDPGTTSLFSY